MKEKIKQIITKERTPGIVNEGIRMLAEIVGVTLGPSGRPVLIEREGLSPLVTKDGVTVAKTIGVEDSATNTIIEAAKEICLRTAKEAGDGTTSAIVMAAKLSEVANEYFAATKVSPQLFMRKMNLALKKTIELIEAKKNIIQTDEQLLNIALISTNSDPEMAKVVIEAVKQAGDEGHIIIEEATGKDLEIDKTMGYCINTGLKEAGPVAQAFINDRANSCFQGQNGLVMLYNGSIVDLSPIKTLTSVIEAAVNEGKMTYNSEAIVIIAHGFSDTVYEFLSKETLLGHPFIPIKTPRSGVPAAATEMLFDLGCYFNCDVVDLISVNELCLENLGVYEKLKCTHYESIISHFPVSTMEHAARIDIRIEELRAQLEQAPSEFDKAHVRSAIARLSEGLVTIKVSGNSDLEVRERKARVEDAVEALRSALQSGFVAGGGATHLRIAWELAAIETDDEMLQDAYLILGTAISQPSFLLLDNAGVPEIWKFYNQKISDGNFEVYDAMNHVWLEPDQQQIIEPVKVLVSSISNAVSVAGLLTTLGGMVTIPRHADVEAQMDAAKSLMGSGVATS